MFWNFTLGSNGTLKLKYLKCISVGGPSKICLGPFNIHLVSTEPYCQFHLLENFMSSSYQNVFLHFFFFFFFSLFVMMQTCQPLRILRNHYAFRVSNTPLRKPVKNVEKLRILRNFGAIRSIPRNLQQLSRLVVSRKSPAGQNIDKGLVYFTIAIGIGVRFRHPINKGSCRGETMPNET